MSKAMSKAIRFDFARYTVNEKGEEIESLIALRADVTPGDCEAAPEVDIYESSLPLTPKEQDEAAQQILDMLASRDEDEDHHKPKGRFGVSFWSRKRPEDL